MPGVVHTQAGWLEKLEVVELLYDPKLTDVASLLRQAKGIRRFSRAWFEHEEDLATARKVLGEKANSLVGGVRRAKESDQLFYLRKSALWGLGLEGAQARRANAMLGQKKSPKAILSPKQRERLKKLEAEKKRKKSPASRPEPGK